MFVGDSIVRKTDTLLRNEDDMVGRLTGTKSRPYSMYFCFTLCIQYRHVIIYTAIIQVYNQLYVLILVFTKLLYSE